MPNEVKYLIAGRCVALTRAGRFGEVDDKMYHEYSHY